MGVLDKQLVVDSSFLDKLRAMSDKEFKHADELFASVLDNQVDKIHLIFLALINHKVDKLTAMEELLSAIEGKIEKDIDKISTESLVEFYSKSSDRFMEELAMIRDIVSRINQRSIASITQSSFLPKSVDTGLIPDGTLPVKIYNTFQIPMPRKATPQSEAYDICTPTRLEIPHLSTAKINTGLIIQTPPGYHYEVRIRSGLASKGLAFPTGVSIIDEDYCGKDDHLWLIITNVSHKDVFVIEEGSRIAQMTIVKNSPEVVFLEQTSPSFGRKESRGGLGSTGYK